MARNRTATVVIGLMSVGGLLGALAGVVTVAAGLFSIGLRNGQVVWPLSGFGSFIGAVVGGGLGALMTPNIAFNPWRYIPIGRLFTHLTLGTIVGGCAGALLFPNPAVAILGGLLGFLVAGDRLAVKGRSSAPSGEVTGPRTLSNRGDG